MVRFGSFDHHYTPLDEAGKLPIDRLLIDKYRFSISNNCENLFRIIRFSSLVLSLVFLSNWIPQAFQRSET